MIGATETGRVPRAVEAIPTQMHDEKKPGDVLKVPGDPLDDVADDVRYGIYTFITTSEKPRELEVMEELRRLAQQVDLTSSLIRHKQMVEETQGSSKPIQIGRYRPPTRGLWQPRRRY